jgi:hypothetical protein
MQVTTRLKDALTSLEAWQLARQRPAPLSFEPPLVDVMLGVWMLAPDSSVICDPTNLGVTGKRAHSLVGTLQAQN